jgi:hypothetical protein
MITSPRRLTAPIKRNRTQTCGARLIVAAVAAAHMRRRSILGHFARFVKVRSARFLCVTGLVLRGAKRTWQGALPPTTSSQCKALARRGCGAEGAASHDTEQRSMEDASICSCKNLQEKLRCEAKYSTSYLRLWTPANGHERPASLPHGSPTRTNTPLTAQCTSRMEPGPCVRWVTNRRGG